MGPKYLVRRREVGKYNTRRCAEVGRLLDEELLYTGGKPEFSLFFQLRHHDTPCSLLLPRVHYHSRENYVKFFCSRVKKQSSFSRVQREKANHLIYSKLAVLERRQRKEKLIFKSFSHHRHEYSHFV